MIWNYGKIAENGSVGDATTGQTCLLYRFCEHKFGGEYIPTIFQNYNKDYEFNGKRIMLRISDIAGEEAYESVRHLQYPDTDVVLICFSLVSHSHSSYNNVRKVWYPEMQKHCPNTPIILVGAKQDLKEDERAIQPITRSQGIEMAKKIGAVKYLECSALMDNGVTEVIHEAIKRGFALDGW